tara:strand:- start:1309 stop:2484 length:1176 start_codon:yes stop_codon:yes gene_type:complete
MNIPIWPGSSSFVSASASYYAGSTTTRPTPFGYYDADATFKTEANKVADWCARKLGYPIMEVELQDINLFAAFEESVTEFSTQVNMSNAKDYMLTLQGTPTSNQLSQRVVTPNLGRTISMAKQYGSEAGSGGDVDYKKGYIELVGGQSEYDLTALWANVNESGSAIEIKRVYHDFTPAIVRYFDPYVGTGAGTQQMLDSFGWGSYSPAVSFMVQPLYADLLRMQAIELNDTIRKSTYSFELRNNKLKLFPTPTYPVSMWFEYVVTADRNNPLKAPTGSISDLSNVPYSRIQFTNIKDIGLQWIYKYTLATAKEMLGLIRGKYSTVPIPGSEMTLNGADLIAQGREDKVALILELNTLLTSMTRQGQMEQETAIATSLSTQLSKVPLYIYIK